MPRHFSVTIQSGLRRAASVLCPATDRQRNARTNGIIVFIRFRLSGDVFSLSRSNRHSLPQLRRRAHPKETSQPLKSAGSAPASITLASIIVCMKCWSVARIIRSATSIPILLVLLLSACGNDSQQAREALVSWSKSLELVEQQRAQRRIPETYVRQMARGATTALNRYRKQLPDDPVVHRVEAKIHQLTTVASNSAP